MILVSQKKQKKMLTVCVKTIDVVCQLFWIKKYDENVIYFQGFGDDDVEEYNLNNDSRSIIKIHEHGDNCITDFEIHDRNIYAIRNDMLVCKNIDTEHQKILIQPHKYLITSNITTHNNLIYVAYNFGVTNSINTIKVFNRDGICVQTFDNGHNHSITCILIHNDILYSSSGDIKLWSLDGKCIKTLPNYNNTVEMMVIYKNKLYSSSCGYIFKWSLDGTFIKILLELDHPENNYIIHFQIHNDLIYVNQDGKFIRIYTLKGKLIKIFNNHDKEITYLHIYDNLMYTSSEDSTIKIWGEYYPHNRKTLSAKQENLIEPWLKTFRINKIQKDLAFVIERELLSGFHDMLREYENTGDLNWWKFRNYRERISIHHEIHWTIVNELLKN